MELLALQVTRRRKQLLVHTSRTDSAPHHPPSWWATSTMTASKTWRLAAVGIRTQSLMSESARWPFSWEKATAHSRSKLIQALQTERASTPSARMSKAAPLDQEVWIRRCTKQNL